MSDPRDVRASVCECRDVCDAMERDLVAALDENAALQVNLQLAERERDEALEVARALREAFPDTSWQHSRESADAADGFDEAWARYRRARDGAKKPSVPRTSQSRSAS